jgi:thiamine-phosphate diphosphorylase
VIPRLHLVTDDRVLASPRFQHAATEALEAGGSALAIHLRGPGTDARTLWERGRALQRPVREAGGVLLVNDRVDLARLLAADGVHLPEHGLPVSLARGLLPEGTLVGRSMHEPESPGADERPDFLLVGTLFPTPTHPGRAGAGPRRILEIRALLPGIPAVGIGGITLERVPPVTKAGGHGVAVLRAIWEHPHPGRAVEAFLSALEPPENATRATDTTDDQHGTTGS